MSEKTPTEIDAAVRSQFADGKSLYQVDEHLLRKLQPDLILTQDLCQACAPSGQEVAKLLRSLVSKPQVLLLIPKCLSGIEENAMRLGGATGRSREAAALVAAWRARLDKVASHVRKGARRPRVFYLEWVNPIYCAGHWVPEMIDLAGCTDVLGRKGADSVTVRWEQIQAAKPEVLIVGPCGFNAAQAAEQALQLRRLPQWKDLPAVRKSRVFAVDANAYFTRPGPRVIDGTELLAHLIHPETCQWRGPDEAFRRIE